VLVLLGRKGVIDMKEAALTDLQERLVELHLVLVVSDFRLFSWVFKR
jgi:hypothetical protein